MKISISKIELTNFKCFRNKEITFDSDITTIRGRNGVGKTTIADAILWCLFGKNSQGQSDFDLKTHDDNGKSIPNLDHSVELILSCDEREITLKRTLKETWVKKRGSDEQVFKNNTTEYLVNGDSFTAADYKKFIANLIDESIFRAITNPNYFPSLKWQDQRQFLTAMVGEIEPEIIADTDELVDLVHQLDNSNEDIVSYRKHLSYQIKQIKDKLDKIPVRLEEQNKALPEKLDWESIDSQRIATESQLADVNEKIIATKSGNGGDVLRDEIRKEIYAVRVDMEKIENEQRKSLRAKQDEHDQAVNEARSKFNQLVSTQRDLETTLPSFDRMIERCKETLAQCDKEAQAIRDEWASNLERKLDWNDDECICPTCGQYLPDALVSEKRNKAIESLNQSKANVKKELTERAENVKKLIADTNDTMKDTEAKKAEMEKELASIKEQINAVFSEKQEIEKLSLPVLDDILKDSTQYIALSNQLSELQAKLDSVGITQDDSTQLTELEAQKAQYNAEISNYLHQLATKEQYEKGLALIDAINEEQKDFIRQLSELEKKEDVARRYQDRQNAVLESRINEHFKLVQWKMFRTVNNGGDPFDEPYCECYVNGVAYHDGLNQAARLNAGLDIINALSAHYNVSAPIVLDNSESTINIISTIGQQIRLQVADTDFQLV